MKRNLMLLLLILTLVSNVFFISAESKSDSSDMTIIFTHDLHSHIDPFALNGNSVGGFARISTVINSIRDNNDNIIVLDGGDFSMGTLYQTLFESEASEYRLLAELGFDATTFGNHEFDYGEGALELMISNAKSHCTSLPPFLCSNLDAEASGLREEELNDLNIEKYRIFQKGEYKVAVFGLLGRDAMEVSVLDEFCFSDYIESARNTVAELESLYSPDLIICLSHSGTGVDVDDEDVELAESVDGIDVIISGHTHTFLYEPIIVNDTIIASCGEYGEYVGNIQLDINDDGISLLSYELIPIDSSVPEDNELLEFILPLRSSISDYLNHFGYESPEQIIAHSDFHFPEQSSMYDSLKEQQLGNLISDSYIYSIKNEEGMDYINVDVAVAPLGVIRASIDSGDITVSQIYEISSLGIGPDGVSGYPLCSVYLYGRELWDLAEVDASVSSLMPYAQLYFSGLGYSCNTNRMLLDRVYDCWLIGESGERIEIEDDKLYRVVSGMSSTMMLGTVKEKSFGLLELTPKDRFGNEIIDFNEYIAKDNKGSELKEWKALADYVSSFDKNIDGVPVIPEKYIAAEGRKNINDDIVLSEIFTDWGSITWIVFALVNVIVSIIVLIVFVIIKKRIKKKRAFIALEGIE